MTCVGCGWLGGASRKARAARAFRVLQGPCRRGLDCGCRAGLGLFLRARTNCDAESEPEGRGWRSCWGGELSRLPVGAPPPTSGSALTSPTSCRPKFVLVPVPGTSSSSLCLAHSLPFRSQFSSLSSWNAARRPLLGEVLLCPHRPVAFLTGLWFRAGTTHLPFAISPRPAVAQCLALRVPHVGFKK